MRKGPLFALGMCAAALLGQVSLTLAEHVQSSAAQTSGQQSATPRTQQKGKQASNQKAQSAPTSPQTGSQASAPKPPEARQSPQTGKQSPSPNAQAAPPSPQTGQQVSGQKPQAARPPAIPPGFRLLSLKEGQTFVQEMSWADDEEGLAPDCSHLVHRLYEQAGYTYPYTNSLDLYGGTGQFLRVRYAQPGDLIVWRGHVGIVVDPHEHSFFSTTSSGTRILDYRSQYWRARGSPRFFRYLTKGPLKGGTSEASNRPPGLQPPASQPPTTQRKDQAVIGGGENRPTVQSVKAAPIPAALAADKPRGDTAASKPHEETGSARTERTENSSRTASSQTSLLQIPLRVVGKQPKAAEVTSALQAANLEAGEILRAGNLKQLERPVVVYRQLQVSAVEVKGKRGLAQIQVETVAALTAARAESQVGREDHQLELQRTNKGWVVVQGNEIAYVPRDGAMRILAARLAALTQSTERSTTKDREQADIVRFMNLLVE